MPRALAFAAALALLAGPAFAADDARTKAAEALLKSMKVDKVLQQSIDQMLDMQAKQNPAMAKMRPAMTKFFAKYMSWDALKPDMVALYAEEFTAGELDEMTKFYQTPTGQKMVDKMPALTAKGMQLGLSKVQAHQAELREMIEAEMKK